MLNRTWMMIAIGACAIVGAARGGSIVKMLVNARTSSPVLQVAAPRAGAACSRELRLTVIPGSPMRAQFCDKGYCSPADPNSFSYRDRTSKVVSSDLKLAAGDPSAGPVIPVDGPDDLKWLCREDEEGKQCICIPWFQ